MLSVSPLARGVCAVPTTGHNPITAPAARAPIARPQPIAIMAVLRCSPLRSNVDHAWKGVNVNDLQAAPLWRRTVSQALRRGAADHLRVRRCVAPLMPAAGDRERRRPRR